MLVNGKRVSGAKIRGIVPAEERKVGTIEKHMTAGSLDDLKSDEYRIVLGAALAEELRVNVGDSVVLAVAKATVTPFGVMPRMRRFTVSGIFQAGMYEYDRTLALVAMEDAARLSNGGNALRLHSRRRGARGNARSSAGRLDDLVRCHRR